MSDTKQPKKSETIEIRIPHPTKLAFMQKARSEGRAASDVVRERIDAYLNGPAAAQPPRRRWTGMRRYLGALVLLPVIVGGLLAVAAASAPAAAQPELQQALAILDANHDGWLDRAEFVSPSAAHEIDIRGVQPAPAGALAIGDSQAPSAYVRYMLVGLDVPLLIAVDTPSPGRIDDAQLARLVGKAFDRLDRNGDGQVSAEEFERG